MFIVLRNKYNFMLKLLVNLVNPFWYLLKILNELVLKIHYDSRIFLNINLTFKITMHFNNSVLISSTNDLACRYCVLWLITQLYCAI